MMGIGGPASRFLNHVKWYGCGVIRGGLSENEENIYIEREEERDSYIGSNETRENSITLEASNLANQPPRPLSSPLLEFNHASKLGRGIVPIPLRSLAAIKQLEKYRTPVQTSVAFVPFLAAGTRDSNVSSNLISGEDRNSTRAGNDK